MRSEYHRAYYETHKEEIKARRREWYANNKEHAATVMRSYYERNRSRILEYSKAYRGENKDAIAEAKKTPDYRAWKNEYDRQRRVEFPGIKRAQSHARRSAEGKFSPEDIRDLYSRQSARCANLACRKSIKRGYHIDHVVPIRKGGSNWPDNLQLLCPNCNLRKHVKSPEQWASENGLLFC